MPLHPSVRQHIIEQLGDDQVPIHERLHDAIDQAWALYARQQEILSAQLKDGIAEVDAQIPRHEPHGPLREQRRDWLERVDMDYQTKLRAAHDAYERACQVAHAQARGDGLRTLS